MLISEIEAPYYGQYNEFVAPELVHRAFGVDGLDVKDLRAGGLPLTHS